MSRSRNLDRMTRYQWFESGFLQQTVWVSPSPRPLQVEKPAVPRGCAPLRSAETRSNWSKLRKPALLSLSGDIPVPQCRCCGWGGSSRARAKPAVGLISSKAEQGALLVPGQRQT